MPDDASIKARLVAEKMRLVMGLRARLGERRPLPFSTPFACELLGWGEDYRKASAAIRELEAAGVIRCVGELPPQSGRARGTKCYAPPLAADLSRSDEAAPVAVEALDGVDVSQLVKSLMSRW